MKHNYNETFDWYNEHANRYIQKTNQRNIDWFIKNLPGKKILDAGCGPGKDTQLFTEKGFEATGMDILPKFIELAKNQFPKVNFVLGNMLELPFPNQSFDGIWVQASLVHMKTVSDTLKALKEFYRVLKPKGILYVRVKLQEGSKKYGWKQAKNSTHARFFRYYTKPELKTLFMQAKFTVVKSEIQISSRGINHGQRIVMIGEK